MFPRSSGTLVVSVLWTVLGASVASGQGPTPTPAAVLLHIDPLREIEDPEVPVGTCQVEVDCPDVVGFGDEVFCRISVLQKVKNALGEIDFEERVIPRRVWRRDGERAFA